MSENRKVKTLVISYSTEIKWIDPILGLLNNKMIKRYQKNRDLIEWALSISTKLEMIRILIDELNKINLEITHKLKIDRKNVDECLDRGYAYQSNNRQIFLLLAYMETVIFEICSTFDLTKKFVTNFSQVIEKELKRSFETQYAKIEEINKCKKDIKNIRDDMIHNYAGWINYDIVDNTFNLKIEMPSFKNLIYKKFKSNFLETEKIREIFNGFVCFLNFTRDFLIDEIKKRKNER